MDYLLILAWMALLAAVNAVLFVLIFDGFPDYFGRLGPIGAQLLFFCMLTLPVGLYLFFTEAGKHRATIGKRKAGLQVANTSGQRPAKSQIAIRTIIKILPWELAHTFIWQMQYIFYAEGSDAAIPAWIFAGLNAATLLAIVYVALVLLRKDRRSAHDLLAGTVVVKK